MRKRIYELFLEHRNKRTVARLLNEMGYRTRRGATFSNTTVGRLLRDPLAKGHRLANVTVSLGMKKHRKLRTSSARAFSKVQPIVSEDLWNQANRILDARHTAPPAAKCLQLFAGLTFCMCGRQMSVLAKSPTYVCKKCRNRISSVELDAAFQKRLRNLVLQKEEMTRTPSPSEVIIKTKRKQQQTLSQEAARVREKMDQVYQAYIDNGISEQRFRRTYRPLEARLKQLEEEIPKLLGELDRLKNQRLPWDEILAAAKSLYTGWQTLGENKKRLSVQSLVKRITVWRDNLRIDTW